MHNPIVIEGTLKRYGDTINIVSRAVQERPTLDNVHEAKDVYKRMITYCMEMYNRTEIDDFYDMVDMMESNLVVFKQIEDFED